MIALGELFLDEKKTCIEVEESWVNIEGTHYFNLQCQEVDGEVTYADYCLGSCDKCSRSGSFGPGCYRGTQPDMLPDSVGFMQINDSTCERAEDFMKNYLIPNAKLLTFNGNAPGGCSAEVEIRNN